MNFRYRGQLVVDSASIVQGGERILHLRFDGNTRKEHASRSRIFENDNNIVKSKNVTFNPFFSILTT